ncbi:MAG: hypothetical protein ACRD3W_17875 [Terriglobales bacterium]
MLYAPLTTGNLKYLALAKNLQCLDLRCAHVNDQGVKYIANCANLKDLSIGGNPQVSDASLKYLLNLKHLTDLNLTQTHVTAEGLKQLQPLKLNRLIISEGVFTAQDLRALQQIFKRVDTIKPKSTDATSRHMFAPLH